ncbi:hypothetical protein [Nocardioides limicola]|uniref:hypothetical protein n=1 Tax=Nocardioides limicola TaxID=2803368 RepID=UPI00193C5AC0|nr:hypothetical protein [Nocardioides sp. DJM-14]
MAPDNRGRLSFDYVPSKLNLTWHLVRYLVMACVVAAPVFGYVGFVQSPIGLPSYRPFSLDVAYPMAAATSGVGLVFVLWFFAAWLRRGRCRDGAAIGISSWYLVLGSLTLLLERGRRDEFHGSATAMLLLTGLLVVFSVLTVVYQLLSRPGAHSPRGVRIFVNELSEASRSQLLQERNEALGVLAERGLLSGHEVDHLRLRPLGELEK